MHPTLLKEAALWRGCTVALYGGSFNPGHEGHVHVAKEALKRLGVDAVWVLISPGNPLKRDEAMAPYEARKKSIQTLVGGHPRIHITDIEPRLGTLYTADTVMKLQKLMPKTRFIWIMGADSLMSFDRWRCWRDIARAVPIAVFDRPGYALSGFAGGFVRQFSRFRVPVQQLSKAKTPAWAFVTIPRHTASATEIRSQRGKNWPAQS
ncbi:nicotinate (nicotinamide) nucleotide adenylyltransferase [Kordiimonas marina]|uniref:nicotinate (nicotinamide) nucleotide adenylyltransferase n=1 Tax=Kordiimonas marina TaxID=2872312 RepID=UPI001FF5E935|nr:nicotinate (nicotinamide) nucleotide adenylyltransferase [Kordiimonas marina]MCJ9427876.1 nicotinate (nicotinamide) nucleotide adenylyltransferase [Kordiimonas marina]